MSELSDGDGAAGSPRAPLAAERQAALLAMLRRDGSLRVTEAAAELDVTPMTVRRDIITLDQAGRLVRVHGGAVPLPDDAAPGREPAAPSAPGAGPALGVMIPTLDYHWPGIVGGIEAAARSHGSAVVLRVSSYATADERPVLEGITADPAVGGLLLAPRVDDTHGDEIAAWVTRSGLPAVLIERGPAAPGAAGLDTVATDHARGVRLVVEHLTGLGHRRVGLVLTSAGPTSERLAAAWQSVAVPLLGDGAQHPRYLPDRASPSFPSAVGGVLAAARAAGVTALLVHSDPEAFALVQCAQEAGLQVPQDLSVIAYDDERAGQLSPPITAVRPPREDLGRSAVELLLDRLREPGRPVRTVSIAPSLELRATTGPAPASP